MLFLSLAQFDKRIGSILFNDTSAQTGWLGCKYVCYVCELRQKHVWSNLLLFLSLLGTMLTCPQQPFELWVAFEVSSQIPGIL